MPRARLAAAALAVTICLAAPHGAAAQDSGQPGEFDYYALVLSWSPTYCDREGDRRRDPQCDAEADHGFVMHGLWPQYEKGYPLDCRTETRPWIPNELIAEMRDIMPSRGLIIHEYRSHGTCSGLAPDAYYAAARKLYQRITIPKRFRAAEERLLSSPAAVEQAFLQANEWLSPEMLSISCRNRDLLDVRFCFGKDLEPRACGSNEEQRRLCPLPAIGIPAID